MERLTQRLRTGEVLMASEYEEKYTEQVLKIIAIMEVEGFVFAMNGEKTFQLLKNFAFPTGGNMDCR